MKRNLPRLGFIGAGTVATALACASHGKGYQIVAAASRSFSSARRLSEIVPGCHPHTDKQQVIDNADVIFITTPDDVITQVAGELKWKAGKSALHCSGADTSGILSKAKSEGAAVGVFHPLQTLAGENRAADALLGITFSLEAEEPLLARLKEMAETLGGRWIVLKPEDRALYHASAVMTSNYLVTLVKLAADLWADFGLSREDAVKALIPLLKGTIQNIEAVGLPNCLTGPISRGDMGTIKMHLNDLRKNHNEIFETYRELGLKTIPIALEKGKIDFRKAREIEAVLAK